MQLLRKAPAVHAYLANMRFVTPPDYSEGLAVRPDHRMIAHTAFLITARKLAEEELARTRALAYWHLLWTDRWDSDERRALVGGREEVPTLAQLFDEFPEARFNIAGNMGDDQRCHIGDEHDAVTSHLLPSSGEKLSGRQAVP